MRTHTCIHTHTKPQKHTRFLLVAQQVPGGEVHQAEVLHQQLALRALARARPAQHEHHLELLVPADAYFAICGKGADNCELTRPHIEPSVR
jgi:hypothetical protein